jgi:hypothetical protein
MTAASSSFLERRQMNLSFALVSLAVRHLDDLAPAIQSVQAIIAGPQWVADRAEPTHKLIDLLYPIFDEVEESLGKVSALSPEQYKTVYAEHKATVVSAGIDWQYFITVIIPLAQELYELIRNLKSGQPVEAGRSPGVAAS